MKKEEKLPSPANNNDDYEVLAEKPDLAKLEGVLFAAEFYRGALPHPRFVREYMEIYPDAPKIIFNQFEKQGDHRRELEKRALSGKELRANLGLWLGFIIGLALIGSGTLFASWGHATAGGWMIGGSLVTLVGTFVYGSQKARAERLEKAKIMAKPDDEKQETTEDE